jgi:branched-chain amino acid transport system permease protein
MSTSALRARPLVRLSAARPLWYVALLVVALLVVRLFASAPPTLYLITLMGVYGVAALGLNVMFGMAGMMSLVQAGAMAVGAYVSALAVVKAGLPFIVSLLLGVVLAAALSAFASLVAMRVASHYFVLVSLALAETVSLFLVNQVDLTGGENGLAGIPSFTIGGFSLSDAWPLAATTIVILFLAWYVADAFRASRVGYASVASSSDPQIAMACGISIRRARLIAGTVGGAFAGIAGALFAQALQFLGPSDFGLDKALLFLLIVVIGGLGSNAGTVVAAVVLTYLAEGFLQLQAVGPLVYGLGIMIILVLVPNGFAGLVRRLRHRLRPPVRTESADV